MQNDYNWSYGEMALIKYLWLEHLVVFLVDVLCKPILEKQLLIPFKTWPTLMINNKEAVFKMYIQPILQYNNIIINDRNKFTFIQMNAIWTQKRLYYKILPSMLQHFDLQTTISLRFSYSECCSWWWTQRGGVCTARWNLEPIRFGGAASDGSRRSAQLAPSTSPNHHPLAFPMKPRLFADWAHAAAVAK